MKLSELPALGAALAGGVFAGLTTKPDGTHHAVVLLPDKPAQDLSWQAAVDWAASIDAELPTRAVAAILFANLKAQFEKRWHWTSESFDGSSAWFQDFGYGSQKSGTRKSYEGRARAVRLIQLDAS